MPPKKLIKILKSKNGRATQQYLKGYGKCSPDAQNGERLSFLDVYNKASADFNTSDSPHLELPGREFAMSTHVYKTQAKTAICAANTRKAKEAGLRMAFQSISHKAHRREMKKKSKIDAIPYHSCASEKVINYKIYNQKVYFYGDVCKWKPNLPPQSIYFLAAEHLQPIDPITTNSLSGAQMKDVFKLVPRTVSVNRANNFRDYNAFFNFFSTLLETSKVTVVRGKSKEVAFETNTHKTFLSFGEQVCRGKKGTIEQPRTI